MGKTLQAKEFSFQAHTIRVYSDQNGELLHIAHTFKVVVRRPDRLLVAGNGDVDILEIVLARAANGDVFQHAIPGLEQRVNNAMS